MEFTKVTSLPESERNKESSELIEKFRKSKMKFARVEQGVTPLKFEKIYNSLYQACKRTTGVAVHRINGEIYLCKVDAEGNEL